MEYIFFDLDNTLRFSRPSSGQVFNQRAAALGLDITPAMRRQVARWEHYYFADSPEIRADLQFYTGDDEAFWANFTRRRLQTTGCTPQQVAALAPHIQAYMRDEYRPENWVPPQVFTALQNLKDAGRHLGVLSNRTRSCRPELEELGLLPYFDLALVGGELDAWKPNPLIFHRALQRWGAAPEQAVYVGDNYYADILGAQAAGLRAILVDPDGLFPEAGCTVISSLEELPGILCPGGPPGRILR